MPKGRPGRGAGHDGTRWADPPARVGPDASEGRRALRAVPSCAFGSVRAVRSESELLEEALRKLRQGAPYSVAAVYVAEIGESEGDRVRWRTFVTDGETAGFVDAEPEIRVSARSSSEVPAALIEREVEYAAGRLSRESRLEELLEASPVPISV